ncbi:MAG: hypothetical protein ACE15C_10315 [Phycisphaerae bacterium]
MEVEFSANEAFILAEEVEKKATVFYLDAADNSTRASLRDLFTGLARMEVDHALVFAAMREQLAKAAPPPAAGKTVPAGAEAPLAAGKAAPAVEGSPPLPPELWPTLARSMIDALDDELPNFFSRNQTSQDILRGAMAFERETIAFLTGMKNMMSSAQEKARVDAIIVEELGHLLQLAGQLANL